MSFFNNKDKDRLAKPLVYVHWIMVIVILALIAWNVIEAFSNLLNL